MGLGARRSLRSRSGHYADPHAFAHGRTHLPLPSFAQFRAWFLPWVIGSLTILARAFAGGTPPAVEIMLAMMVAALGVFLLAGAAVGAPTT